MSPLHTASLLGEAGPPRALAIKVSFVSISPVLLAGDWVSQPQETTAPPEHGCVRMGRLEMLSLMATLGGDSLGQK